jgi:DNA-binding transcriptional LysR family regulator
MPIRHKLSNMEFRHLRTFVTVAERGTVSKASARLGIAQPALSRRIQDLEDDLGVRLFDRIRRRLVLTSEGEQLLGDCRAIVAAVGSLKDRAQLLHRPDAGVLKIAATPQTIDGVLSGFLSRYRKHRPNVQVKLSEAFGSALVALLERGEVQLVLATAGALQGGGHPFEKIQLSPIEFVAAYDPALELGHAATIDIRNLARHPLLLLDKSFAVRIAFDAACRVAEFTPHVLFESRTPHTLLALAEAGHGVAIVPSVLPTHRYNLRSVRLAYRRKPLQEGYGIIWDRRRSLPPAAEEFCQLLVSYMREVFPNSRPSGPGSRAPKKRATSARVRR